MKIIEKVLKNKLQNFGFNIDNISEQLKKIDFDLIDNKIAFENEAENFISIKEVFEPNVDIARTLINYNNDYIQSIVLTENVSLSTMTTSIKSVLPIVDYNLSETVCIVSVTMNLGIEILIYNPSVQTIQQYSNQSYENVFSIERNKIAREYYEAFVDNGRVSEGKVKTILTLLLSEYIIDEMAITGANPKIKMYDNIEAYAENITEYRLKYINKRTNRIELAYRPTNIKRLGTNVCEGMINNDPYIKLDNLPRVADFPLNMVSCYWIAGTGNRKEEVAIYIANKAYEYKTYREYCEENFDKYNEIIDSLALQFQKEINKEVDKSYIREILKKLNRELLSPSMDVIRDCMDNPSDPIEPLRYKFKAISSPEDFEDSLYISIEDNMGKRYKYKLTENILEDLTRIGNKLEYTVEDGSIVKKQSIADFNINSVTAIIRRETLIDYSKIPGLLGYIYEDMEYLGTDMLPVPSIEVDFYFPQNEATGISMYNGTSFDMDSFDFSSSNKFNDIEDNESSVKLPGTTSAIVKYINSKGEILKENKILNLIPGSQYVPEILPIISDVNGGEWVCSTTQYPTITVNIIPEYNIVEIKYKEKYSKVLVTFLSREGKKIRNDLVETVQTGIVYDLENKKQYIDEEKNEWGLITSRPQKLLVKDDENSNHLILVYDLEKESVMVKYLNPNGENVIAPKISEVQVGKVYEVPFEKVLIDVNGLGWIYKGNERVAHLVEEGENTVELQYEEYKLPVTVKYQTEDGIPISNDVVEYLQVGLGYDAKYSENVTDINCKEWKLKTIDKASIKVSKDEIENIIKVIYEPMLARVYIQVLDEAGKKILNPIEKFGQIGDEFSSFAIDEITDNYGRVWVKNETPNSLVVSSQEKENRISIKYKPLVTTVIVKFFDDERNELIPSKKYEKQVGTVFKPEIIKKLESSDGRKWFFNDKNIKEVAVRKNIEENIVSIFYEKEVTEVNIDFLDAFGKKLRDSATVKAQIGSEFDGKLFNKIEDKDGGKWMLDSSEPKKMIVKDSKNNFKLFYDEVKSIVVVKHVNVKTNESLIKDVVAKVKLGGVFIPNLQEKIFDSNKCLWKYIGDKNISIVAKENEQENIVILQYDEVLTKVTVKYQDLYNNKIRDDIVYDLQVGKQIDYKKIDSFIDINGMGWCINSSKSPNANVQEDINNEVINYYDPLKKNVRVMYVNDKDEEIKTALDNELQVGRTYKPSYDTRIKDSSNKLWTFKNISMQEVKVSEKGNIIKVQYLPVVADVVQRFFNKTGEKISEEKIESCQVGSIYNLQVDKIFVDSQKKKWNYIKSDCTSLQVKEENGENIINNFFEPRTAQGTIKIYDDNNNEIMQEKKYVAQIGSYFTAVVQEYYIDPKTKLGWAYVPKDSDTLIVDDEVSKNLINIRYEKHMVKVIDRFVDMKGSIVIPDVSKEMQVGVKYEAKIEDEIKDAEGKEWAYNGKADNKLLTVNNTSLIVSDKEEKNIVYLKYKPILANVTIKYQDNLGNIIASREEVQAQVGSTYVPEIKDIIIDVKKNKWVYNPNSKSTIIVSRDEKKNNITLSYEEEKAHIVYKYQDEYKNRLQPPKKVLAQIGSVFIPDPERIIEDEHGRVWEYKVSNVEKIEVKDNEQENIVEITYIPLYVEALINLKNRKGEIISVIKQNAQLGANYRPTLDENIFDEDSMMFHLVKCEPQEIIVKEVPIGSDEEINIFDVTYEPVYSNVTIKYQDISGNQLRDDDLIQLQVGTKYTPKLVQFVKDKKGIQWENIFKEVETIRVKENIKDNIIKMTFELAKAEVLVRYRDIDGNTIKESKCFHENIGAEFVPEIDNIILDGKNRKWIFSVAEPVKLNVGSINNIIDLIYTEKKVPVTIKFETITGKKLRNDMEVSVQEGVQYIPKKNFAIIYDENDIWRYLEFRPSSLLVTDRISENVIVQVYDNKLEETVEKDVLENPFANTLTKEEEEELQMLEKESAMEEENEQNKVEFEESNLVKLSHTVIIEENEKDSIVKLNNINKKIIGKLEEYKNTFDVELGDRVVIEINKMMEEEKNIINTELQDMLNTDKTGKKFVKVLEGIVSEDDTYRTLQERKVILLADYFVNSNITNVEQSSYICERGKNNKEILLLREKVKSGKADNEKLKKIFIDLIYEKAMLDSYYRTRTKSKDEFFDNEEARNSIDSEVIIMVTNILPKQAYNLLLKDDKLTLAQENELDAIVYLLTEQQRKSLEKMINENKDNKIRKAMIKRLKNIK